MRSEYWQGCFETWFFTFSHSSSIEEKDKKEKKIKKDGITEINAV
jgi:hypothetical protein